MFLCALFTDLYIRLYPNYLLVMLVYPVYVEIGFLFS